MLLHTGSAMSWGCKHIHVLEMFSICWKDVVYVSWKCVKCKNILAASTTLTWHPITS